MILKTFSYASLLSKSGEASQVIHNKPNVDDYDVSVEMRSREWLREEERTLNIRAPKFVFYYADKRKDHPADEEIPV